MSKFGSYNTSIWYKKLNIPSQALIFSMLTQTAAGAELVTASNSKYLENIMMESLQFSDFFEILEYITRDLKKILWYSL